MPQVTVIIATYNSSPTLRCALTSLLAQTFQDFECWIVGDCCTDDSEQVVAAFGDSRLHWANLSANYGSQSGPNNEGLRRSRGNYIAYLGHDDLWFPNHLATLVATIERENADFAHAVLACMGPAGKVWASGAPGTKRSYAERFVAPSSWLYRREVFESCGGWPDPNGQVGGVDFVYHRRICLAGKRFACTGEITVVKFPAALWKIYALREGHPQPDYLKRMQENPQQLHAELLHEIIFTYTRRREDWPLWQSWGAAARSILEPLKDWYGLDTWPLSRYLKWKTRFMRKHVRPLKGLPPLGKMRGSKAAAGTVLPPTNP